MRRRLVKDVIEHVRVRVDLPEVVDALADLQYVTEGAFLAFGVNSEAVLDEVQRSNLSKLGGEKREDGKIMKGPNYSPPDIEGELRKQGWTGRPPEGNAA